MNDTAPAPLPTPDRALTVGAHPDDAEFGAGGTVAKWAADGCEVSMLVITDGSKGTWDPALSSTELIAARQEEQRRAAEALGATGEVVFLDHVDGELEYTMELRAEICLWIRRLRPNVVLGFDPWKRYLIHPDHRAAGWAVVDGVVAARDHLFFSQQLTEGLQKHRPETMLLWAAEEADHWEDISATFSTKIEALLCHSSQGETTMENAHSDETGRGAFEHRIREWCQEMGAPVGLELAEAFRRITP